MLKFSTYVERKYLRAAGLGTALGVAAYGAGQLMNDKTPQPTQIQPQIQQVIPEPIEKPLLVRKNVDETAYFAKYIGANEGSRKQVYIDGRGHPTIGIGHLITPQSRDLFTKLFNNSIDFDALLQKREQLTEPQVQILFQHDLKRHLDVATLKPREDFLEQDSLVQRVLIDDDHPLITLCDEVTVVELDRGRGGRLEIWNRLRAMISSFRCSFWIRRYDVR